MTKPIELPKTKIDCGNCGGVGWNYHNKFWVVGNKEICHSCGGTGIIQRSMTTIHIDKNIGVTGGKIFWAKSANGKEHWCRRVIAIMGTYNTSDEYRNVHSPFETGFQDNFIEGRGATKEEALENMSKEEAKISDGLFEI